MSYYGGTITVAGRNLITSLVTGKTIEFTRVVVGSGAMPENKEPIDMTALVQPIAEGVSTIPTVDGGVLSMTVEYRNDLNGGLKEGFWLREFGVFAKTEDTEEILLYYATLGDSPQPVNAYKDNRIDIRRYPITIALELDANVVVSYNPGSFITSGEAQTLLAAMVQDAVKDVGGAYIMDITIPKADWKWGSGVDVDEGYIGKYPCYVDVAIDKAKAEQFPTVALSKAALVTAYNCGLCPTVEAKAGALRFWSQQVPNEDMKASVALISNGGTGGSSSGGSGTYVLPVATTTRLGGVKIGHGVTVDADGTISVIGGGSISDGDIANADELNNALDDVFKTEEP